MNFWQVVTFLETEQLVDLARQAEEVGFHGILTGDHLVQPRQLGSDYPYTDTGEPIFPMDTHWPDTWCAISAMAAVTSRIQFSNAIYLAPMRDLFTVAKLVSTAAAIAGGRVALGIGVGWMREEYACTGQDFTTRGRRLDEMIPVLRDLWTGEWVEHHGTYYDFEPLLIAPAAPGPIPIWYGGNSDVAYRRATHECDGWINGTFPTPDDLVAQAAHVSAERRAAGKPTEGFEIISAVDAPIDAPLCRRLEDAGVTGIIVAPWISTGVTFDNHRSPIEQKRAAMEAFAESVIDKV
jgi:probable F420-dependent oxidoreductase